MELLEVKTNFETFSDCFLKVGRYHTDKNLAIQLFSISEGLIAMLTICLCDPSLKENESYVDTNNYPWAVDFLERKGLAKLSDKIRLSGYCIYPVMEFNRENMKKFEEDRVWY